MARGKKQKPEATTAEREATQEQLQKLLTEFDNHWAWHELELAIKSVSHWQYETFPDPAPEIYMPSLLEALMSCTYREVKGENILGSEAKPASKRFTDFLQAKGFCSNVDFGGRSGRESFEEAMFDNGLCAWLESDEENRRELWQAVLPGKLYPADTVQEETKAADAAKSRKQKRKALIALIRETGEGEANAKTIADYLLLERKTAGFPQSVTDWLERNWPRLISPEDCASITSSKGISRELKTRWGIFLSDRTVTMKRSIYRFFKP